MSLSNLFGQGRDAIRASRPRPCIHLLLSVVATAASLNLTAAQITPIKLAVNPWLGSALNANIAKILLEEKLGYQVELVAIDENAQFPALARGDLSATLEVWPSGHAAARRLYIEEQQTVRD